MNEIIFDEKNASRNITILVIILPAIFIVSVLFCNAFSKISDYKNNITTWIFFILCFTGIIIAIVFNLRNRQTLLMKGHIVIKDKILGFVVREIEINKSNLLKISIDEFEAGFYKRKQYILNIYVQSNKSFTINSSENKENISAQCKLMVSSLE